MGKRKKENVSDTMIIRDKVSKMLETKKLDSKSSDYKEKLKKLCETAVKTKNKCDPMVCSYKIAKDVFDKEHDEIFKRNVYYQKRRITALTKYIPHFVETFENRYPKLPIERTILDLTTMSSTYLPDSTFTTENGANNRWLMLAVAIFILDDLCDNETIEEALLYLPETADIEIIQFKDCVFDENVIKSLIYLIEKKDDEHGCLLSHTSVKRTCDTIPPRQYTETSIPNEKIEKTVELKNKIYEAAQSMTYRERLDKILSLMSPTTVKKAEKQFTTKLHEYLNIIFKYESNVWPEIEKQATDLIDQCNKLDDIINQTKTHIRADISPAKNVCAHRQTADIKRPVADILPFDNMCKQLSDVDRLYDAYDKTAKAINNKQRMIIKQLSDRCANLFYFLNGRNPAIDCPSDEVQKTADAFHIDNPYEICFAYFSLLDSGCDIIWLVEIAAAILSFAAMRLPWLNNYNCKLKDEIDKAKETNVDNPKPFVYNHTKRDAYLYEPKYTDFFAWRMYGVDDPKQEDLLSYNFAQLAFSVGCTILPRKSNGILDKRITEGLIRSGINRTNADIVQLLLEITNQNFQKIELPHKHDPTPDVNALRKTISEKNEKIDELTNSLKATEKQLKAEQLRVETIAKNTEAEQKELFELRELVYKLQNNDVETICADSDPNDIELPYTPHKRLVIFGGHAAWLKAIRQFLPTVKIIEPNENPNINLIRNADAIWMQTNAMPHSYYGKIMDIARQRKIPIKYFTYGSAELCARQLAEYDCDDDKI